jgi:crotonobetainyl-CoA:carnitine CoA-transferase CaiB-like acyl-CoA transferase
MIRPLDGITVIDICDRMAGSVASMMLADNGADVICIENADTKHRDFRRTIWNREKKSITLDLSLGSDSINLQKFEGLRMYC